MLKWLRKYSKALLMFFGVFLMIAFLMPQAISQLGQEAGQTLFTIDGRRVTAKQAQRRNAEMAGVEMATFGVFPRVLGIDTRAGGVDHWIMASEAARRAGFFGAAGDGPELIPAAAEVAVMSQIDPMFLRFVQQSPEMQAQIKGEIDRRIAEASGALPTIATRNGLSERELDLGLAAAKGMLRLREAYLTSPRFSEARLARQAREALDQAEMQVLFIAADPNVALIPDPPEAALVEHFERYKDKTAGVGDDAFGYMRPRRYKLEWMTLERKGIESAVRVSAVDVQKKLLEGEAKEIADAGARRTEVEARLKRAAVDRVFAEAKLAYKSEVLSATRGLASREGMLVIPEGWTRPRMAALAARVAEKVREATGTAIPMPTVMVREAEWLSDAEVGSLPGLGAAVWPRGNSSVSVGQLLPLVKELRTAEMPPMDLPLQVGVPFGDPVEDFTGDRHYFTVLDARPESPAESLAEVRAQVINDRKKADAFSALAARLTVLEAAALGQGLDALAEEVKAAGGVTTDLRSAVRVSRRQAMPADFAANSKAFLEAAGKKMDELDPTAPLDRAVPTDLYVAAAAPGRLGVVIGKFTSFSPATVERFRQATRALMRSAAMGVVDAGEDMLTRERLTKLLRVEIPRGPGEAAPKNSAANEKPAEKPAN